jgi:hypothetical protein
VNRLLILVAIQALALPRLGITQEPASADPEAASVKYSLADTELKLVLTLVLDGCDEATLRVTPTLSITAAAVPGTKRYEVTGTRLAGALKKRDLTLALYENGTIKSLSATTENRLAAVLANVFKLATTLAGTAVPKALVSRCKPEVVDALDRVTALRARSKTLREGMASATDANSIRLTRQALEALAAEIADLRTKTLQVDLTGSFKPAPLSAADRLAGKAISTTVTWSSDPLKKWLVNAGSAEAEAEKFNVNLELTPPKSVEVIESEPTCDKCPFIAIREPVVAKVVALAVTQEVWYARDAPTPLPGNLGELQAPIGQWGQTRYLILKARFGQSRSVKLDFDQFGRKTAFTWGSNASAEGVTAGLGEITSAAAAYSATRVDQTTLQEQQAKVAELETRLKLNKLMACEQILLAGGYACPE